MVTPFALSVGAVGTSCIRSKGFFPQKQPWYPSVSRKIQTNRSFRVISAVQQQNVVFTIAQQQKYDDLTQKILDFIDKLSQTSSNVRDAVSDNLYFETPQGAEAQTSSSLQSDVGSNVDLVKDLGEAPVQIFGGDISSSKEALKNLKESAGDKITEQITKITEPAVENPASAVANPDLNAKANQIGDSLGGLGNFLGDKISSSKDALKSLATSAGDSISDVQDKLQLPEKRAIVDSSKIETAKEQITSVAKPIIELPKVEAAPPPPIAVPTPPPAPSFTPTPPPPPTPAPATEILEDTLSSSKGAISDLKSAGSESIGQAKEAISGTFSGLGESVTSITSSGTSAVDSAKSGVVNQIKNIGDEILGVYQSSNDALKNVISSFGQGVNNQVGGVGNSVSEKIKELFDLLPPEVQGALEVSGAGINAVLDFVREYPIASVSIVAFFSALIYIIYYRSVFAGFAGELSPKESQNLLQEIENSLLVDIRADEKRAETGVPELKRGARKRGASISPDSIFFPDKQFLKRVNNPQQLRDEIFVTYIAGLPSINRNTSVVLMDEGSDEKKVKEFARTLYSLYLPNSYVMKGGYRGWEKDLLPIRMDTPNYEVQTSEIIKDELEVLKEKTEDIKEVILNPQILLGIVVLISSGTYLVFNYEKTLQFIGFLGIILTIANRVDKRYDNLDDVRQDVVNVLEYIGGLVEKAGFTSQIQEPVLQTTSQTNTGVQYEDEVEVVLPEGEEEEKNVEKVKKLSEENEEEKEQIQNVQIRESQVQEISEPVSTATTKSATDGQIMEQKNQKLEQVNENVEVQQRQPQNGTTNFGDKSVRSE